MTYMTVAINKPTAHEAGAMIQEATVAGADAVELRVDFLQPDEIKSPAALIEQAKQKKLVVIVTPRHVSEGGHFEGSDTERLKILEKADHAGADYVDMEIKHYLHRPWQPQQARLILSYHDFEGCPADLNQRLAEMKAVKGAIPKVAFMPRDINEAMRALDILHENPGAIAIAMGEGGIISRLAAARLGGLLSFFTLDEGAGTAPGQITVEKALNRYNWRRLTEQTRLFGVCGHPVAHSMSPLLHNQAFAQAGYDGLYMPLLVQAEAEGFDRLMQNILDRPWLGFRGLSVTVPHKQAALESLRSRGARIDKLALKIGALNTIVFEDDGGLSGYNTDYVGAMNGIYQTLNMTAADLKKMPAAVLGAGGAARAIVAGLVDAGAKVTIFNRTVAKARDLAEVFGCKYDALEQLDARRAKLLVNCTTLGMHPQQDSCPVGPDFIRKNMIVFDNVYNPLKTKLLQLAEQAGARTVDGVSMFVNQAMMQFEYFTGLAAPGELMNQTVRKILEK